MKKLYVLLEVIEDADFDEEYNIGKYYFESYKDAEDYLFKKGYEYVDDYKEYKKYDGETYDIYKAQIREVYKL